MRNSPSPMRQRWQMPSSGASNWGSNGPPAVTPKQRAPGGDRRPFGNSATGGRSCSTRILRQDAWDCKGTFVSAGRYRLPARVGDRADVAKPVCARNMFIDTDDDEVLETFEPGFTVIDACSLAADPATDGTRTGTLIVVDPGRKLILIGGTEYAGEIKKSIFSVMNYLLPRRGVMSMHCSANYGEHKDDVALFFGLSGTGKTALSADPRRTLIGDDEHGWSDDGVFNVEVGCYAKVIRLSPGGESEHYLEIGPVDCCMTCHGVTRCGLWVSTNCDQCCMS